MDGRFALNTRSHQTLFQDACEKLGEIW